MPPTSFHTGRFRRLIRFHQWQQVALLATAAVHFALAAQLSWINLVGFTAVYSLGWFWIVAVRHYCGQASQLGTVPRYGWDKLFIAQLLVTWTVALGCLAFSNALLAGLPLIAIASAPAYLLGYARLGNIFYGGTGLLALGRAIISLVASMPFISGM